MKATEPTRPAAVVSTGELLKELSRRFDIPPAQIKRLIMLAKITTRFEKVTKCTRK